MLQLAFIRENKEIVLKGLAKRHFKEPELLIEKIIALDENRRLKQSELDSVLAESNALSKEIGQLFKNGESQKAENLKLKTIQLRDQSKTLTDVLNDISDSLNELLYLVPNIPSEQVPFGKTPEDNEVIFEQGVIPTLHKNALPHWELAKKYDIIDFELGNKITGAGFPVYKGKGARLQRALINYFIDKILRPAI